MIDAKYGHVATDLKNLAVYKFHLNSIIILLFSFFVCCCCYFGSDVSLLTL